MPSRRASGRDRRPSGPRAPERADPRPSSRVAVRARDAGARSRPTRRAGSEPRWPRSRGSARDSRRELTVLVAASRCRALDGTRSSRSSARRRGACRARRHARSCSVPAPRRRDARRDGIVAPPPRAGSVPTNRRRSAGATPALALLGGRSTRARIEPTLAVNLSRRARPSDGSRRNGSRCPRRRAARRHGLGDRPRRSGRRGGARASGGLSFAMQPVQAEVPHREDVVLHRRRARPRCRPAARRPGARSAARAPRRCRRRRALSCPACALPTMIAPAPRPESLTGSQRRSRAFQALKSCERPSRRGEAALEHRAERHPVRPRGRGRARARRRARRADERLVLRDRAAARQLRVGEVLDPVQPRASAREHARDLRVAARVDEHLVEARRRRGRPRGRRARAAPRRTRRCARAARARSAGPSRGTASSVARPWTAASSGTTSCTSRTLMQAPRG